MTVTRCVKHLKTSIINWWERDPFTQSAAVAYYTIFSFPALMILYFATASIFVEHDQLQLQTYQFLSEKFGENAATQFGEIIDNTAPKETDVWAFVIGGATLLFAGLKLFMQFQKALNHIWETDESRLRGIKAIVVRRAVSFGVMLGIGFTLLVSFLMTSIVTFFTEWIMAHLPDYFAYLVHGINFLVSLSVITFMFALMLKELPDTDISWKHSLPGAFVAALLFILGQYMLGIYFSVAEPGSAYGVTGSLILMMLWVSYSCVILLLGAEVSKTLCVADDSLPSQA